MKKIAFVGGMDKFDIILYTAIIVSQETKSKILLVDATDMQKTKYIVPNIENVKDKFVSDYQGITIASGYKTKEEILSENIIENVQDAEGNEKENFDYIFIDADHSETIDSFMFSPENDLIFFMTTFDLYSVKKGIEALNGIKNKCYVNRVVAAKKVKNEHLTYLSALTKNENINWGNANINFPYDNGDLTIIQDNERDGRLNLKPFSREFKGALRNLTKVISGANPLQINITMSKIEKS